MNTVDQFWISFELEFLVFCKSFAKLCIFLQVLFDLNFKNLTFQDFFYFASLVKDFFSTKLIYLVFYQKMKVYC